VAAEQGVLGVELVPPRSVLGELAGPVWGIDPSTRRISVARLLPPSARVDPSLTEPRMMLEDTLSLEQGGPHRGARLSKARPRLAEWFAAELAFEGEPHVVALEEPFGAMFKGKRQVPVIGLEIQGMLLAALWEAFGLRTEVMLVSPSTWKKAAMGAGHGFAKPPAYMAWAREACGYAGDLEDEAAALGVATWGALEVVKRRG
jgi:hypothetical protein